MSNIDPVLLSRIQFGATIGFHFIFAPLTIGLAWLIFWMMTRYKRTNSAEDRNNARLWIRIFTASFVVGVASGITMEFQFGTNWAKYSRFVGDIFGVPLAVESISSFFLESTFLGLLIFGWNRVSTRTLWFASLMVAVGSTLSALWILIANSWQQTPAGFHIVNGRAELTSLWAAAMNPSTVPRFLHTITACLMTGAFFAMGWSALYLLKNKHSESASAVLKMALVMAFVTSLAQLPFGHIHAVQVAETQPAKLAAFEGQFTTCSNAPLTLFGIPDAEKRCINYAVRVPGMLSFLIYGRTSGEVKGLEEFPRDEWPPLLLSFAPFHIMVIIGFYLIGFSGFGILLWKLGKLEKNKLFGWAAVLSMPLPFIANELGWMAAEVGRQPWVVYNILKTSDAISVSVPASQILFTMITFGLIYALMFAAWLLALRREFRHGPVEPSGKEGY